MNKICLCDFREVYKYPTHSSDKNIKKKHLYHVQFTVGSGQASGCGWILVTVNIYCSSNLRESTEIHFVGTSQSSTHEVVCLYTSRGFLERNQSVIDLYLTVAQ